MNSTKKSTILWITIAILAMAIAAVYVSLSLKIQDSEKRSFEALHEQRLEIDQLKQQSN